MKRSGEVWRYRLKQGPASVKQATVLAEQRGSSHEDYTGTSSSIAHFTFT